MRNSSHYTIFYQLIKRPFVFFIQASDIFAASLSSPEKRLYVAREIATILGVPHLAETMQPTDKPIIQACLLSFYIYNTCSDH